MRGRTHRAPEEANVDLTPMLDVVFILLIFFIVTSTFAQEETIGLEPPPPPSPETDQQPVSAILIYIDESNLITVNGRVTDIGSVRANIERVRAENPESQVVIQAHPKSRNGVIVLIRDAAYNAGYTTGVNLVLSQTE
ncbi:MAG: biopolymer transporter ExbD [Hyphomonas sp.]|uniref:ExbD/TolR family protein n=1 Tax=Hyphomonas sp. TaxID=87 RepID=UPI001B1E80D5|nr:biopolymer transporter ExbD [Hyphomonas sp.]MBO6583786.1 biopolymer transporter ExbD [Hyphomonas sp.]